MMLLRMIPLHYKLAAALVALCVVWGHGYITRGRLDQSASLRVENASLKRNLTNVQTILAAANQRETFSMLYVGDLKDQIDGYKKWSALGNSFSCNLDVNRVGRLSAIANAASRGKHSTPPRAR